MLSPSFGAINVDLTAILICQDRELASALTQSVESSRSFQIMADLKHYPPNQTLEIRLRQVQPDVVLLDLASNLDTACELIQLIGHASPGTHVIGIHRENSSEALLRSLRLGARDFLYFPFDSSAQLDAASRIRKLKEPEPAAERELGKVIAFASSKPGSGSSTLSAQMAFTLKRLTGKKVLLLDLDLMGGTIGFYLKLNHPYSMLDAIEQSGRLNPAIWGSLVSHFAGIDILPAPEAPVSAEVASDRLHQVLQYARLVYDWIVVDLPAIFYRPSLLMLTETEQMYLVSTSELPSLHLARKAIAMLTNLGLTKDRYRLLVNRVNKRDEIGLSDLEKIFNSPVEAMFPNDYFSLHRVVTLGQPLGADCELGKAVEGLAKKMSGTKDAEKKKSATMLETARPALSQT
ncbi:P-loop NTPase [Bryobacter aggregatus]|uniref:P-loop NTPase n=1 Tax=Bryobacter aggregatus TaxID=360054 RepID=UPI0004E19669|nr:P-loop NTPase [Bryobacter aggregatus]